MSRNKKRGTVKTVVSVIMAVLLFSLIIFALYKIDFIDVLEFIPSMFQKRGNDTDDNNSEKIKELIELLEKNEGGYESVKLDPKNAMSMLSAAPVKDSYYHAYSVTYTHGEDVTVKNVFVTKSGNSWTVSSREGNTPGQTVSFDGNVYTVKDDTTLEKTIYSKESGMTFEGQTYLTPIAKIKSLLSEYEAAQGSERKTRITDASAELVRTQTENIVLLEFRYGATEQTEEYMIHLDYGVILAASAYMSGDEYYKVTTSVFNPD